jgi:hypothetical protein
MINITKIYLVTNCYGDPNKVYVGKTKSCRYSSHKKTYGEQITYTYIDQTNSLERKYWQPLESYWIEQFRQWGFEVVNIQKKGGSGVEFHTEETKFLLSEMRKGKPQPNISAARKGKPMPGLKGLKRSQETKDKMSQNRMGIPNIQPSNYTKKLTQPPKPEGFGENISQKHGGKPVGKYSLNGELIQTYPYTETAALKNKINPANLRAALKGRQLTSGGFIWKYL